VFYSKKLFCYKDGIEIKKHMNELVKELFRKAIHMCTAFIPFFLVKAYVPVLVLLFCVLVFYCVAEILRFKGFNVPIISVITATAARKRDEHKFVLGPATLATGVLITAVLFDIKAAGIGIMALAFGDGLASLVGKFFGRILVPFSKGKTVGGSLTCFIAIFCSTFILCNRVDVALGIAFVGMIIELIPIKDFDNLLIPIILAAFAQFYFHI